MQCYMNVEAGLYYCMVSNTSQHRSSNLSSMLYVKQNQKCTASCEDYLALTVAVLTAIEQQW